MNNENSNPWNGELKKTISEIVADTMVALQNPPDEITATITLKGLSAARYNFVYQILKSSFELDENEIAAYILRAGAEREIERMAFLFPKEGPLN